MPPARQPMRRLKCLQLNSHCKPCDLTKQRNLSHGFLHCVQNQAVCECRQRDHDSQLRLQALTFQHCSKKRFEMHTHTDISTWSYNRFDEPTTHRANALRAQCLPSIAFAVQRISLESAKLFVVPKRLLLLTAAAAGCCCRCGRQGCSNNSAAGATKNKGRVTGCAVVVFVVAGVRVVFVVGVVATACERSQTTSAHIQSSMRKDIVGQRPTGGV